MENDTLLFSPTTSNAGVMYTHGNLGWVGMHVQPEVEHLDFKDRNFQRQNISVYRYPQEAITLSICIQWQTECRVMAMSILPLSLSLFPLRSCNFVLASSSPPGGPVIRKVVYKR